MKNKDLVSISDLSSDEVWHLLRTASRLKGELKAGVAHPALQGKSLAMIFQKPSLRTRVSFEMGMRQLGGHAIFISPEEIHLGKRESVPDVARVLSRYVDGIMARTYAHQDVMDLAKYATVPVINGLSDLCHPCQALADLLTIWEKKGHFDGLTLAYVGDGNNMANSLLIAGANVGMNVVIGCPPGYEPPESIVQRARLIAAQNGAKAEVVHDVKAAVAGADVMYTDVWTSMGQEDEYEQRLGVFRPYQLNAELVSLASPSVVVMHCLPAHRGEEVTEEVIESSRSVVFDQAENRLHAQKSVLLSLMAD